MKFKNLNAIDKAMYCTMMVLASISMIIMTYFIIYIIMSVMNASEFSKILIDANIYQVFYKILTSLNKMIIPTIFLVYIGIIPYLLISTMLGIFFIIRYVKFNGKKATKIVAELIFIIVIIFLLVIGILTFPLTSSYEIEVNANIDEIPNNEVKDFVKKYLSENYYIYDIKIYQGFPDDYKGYINYKDVTKKTRNIILSDSESQFIYNNAEDKTSEYAIEAIILLLVGYIIYIVFIIFIEKEFKRIANYKDNVNIGKFEDKKKLTKKAKIFIACIAIAIILIIAITIIMYVSKNNKQSNLGKSNNINYSTNSEELNDNIILYQKQINKNIIIRVKYVGEILAQRSIIVIEKSTDGGKSYTNMNEEGITIHNGAEFVFINENIGFINDPGLAGTDGENKGLLVTNDGGVTFKDANIIHPDGIEEKDLFVYETPYIKDEILEVKIYTINHSKNPEKTYYTFYSIDNGLNWKLKC